MKLLKCKYSPKKRHRKVYINAQMTSQKEKPQVQFDNLFSPSLWLLCNVNGGKLLGVITSNAEDNETQTRVYVIQKNPAPALICLDNRFFRPSRNIINILQVCCQNYRCCSGMDSYSIQNRELSNCSCGWYEAKKPSLGNILQRNKQTLCLKGMHLSYIVNTRKCLDNSKGSIGAGKKIYKIKYWFKWTKLKIFRKANILTLYLCKITYII